MRTFLVAAMALTWLWAGSAPAKTIVTGPKGDLLELHSCELYTGGCFASSEATMEGRHMVRVWNFTGGTQSGTELRGLQVAVLQVGDDNLAAQGTRTSQSVVYLPSRTTQTQRDALLAWLESNEPTAVRRAVATRVVPMTFTRSGQTASFSAGDFVQLDTRPMESCDKGGCGEDLWYTPRTSTASFTVNVARQASINEPALSLKWSDHGKRAVFSGSFGASATQANAFLGVDQLHATTHLVHDVNR